MRLRNRFLLVGFGVVVFIVLTPILVLFTRGYQIDWTNRRFVKTGVFVVKTMPAKADIYLNDKKTGGATPETLRFLLPGDYNVRIEKEGYQSWTKRLHIQAQLATWINYNREFITLFLNQPEELKTASANFSSLSENGGEIAYVHNDLLYMYNTTSSSTQNYGDISGYILPYTFGPHLVWSNGSDVLNLFQKGPKLPFDAKAVTELLSDGKHLAYLADNQLFVSDEGSPLKLVDKQVTGITIDGENLWYIQNQFLKQYNLRTENLTTIAQNLPQSSKASVIRGEGNTFLLIGNSLYTINDHLEKIYDGVNFANYDSQAHRLIFSNPNEILIYNPGEKNTELVVRSISPVTNPLMNFYTGYVFFENENQIKAIELDGRDHRNIYKILDLTDPDSKFSLSTDGSLLTVFSNSSITSYRIR